MRLERVRSAVIRAFGLSFSRRDAWTAGPANGVGCELESSTGGTSDVSGAAAAPSLRRDALLPELGEVLQFGTIEVGDGPVLHRAIGPVQHVEAHAHAAHRRLRRRAARYAVPTPL